MNTDFQRRELIAEYQSYLAIVSQKGLTFNVVSDEELANMDLSDLSILVRKVRDLARTPTDR